MVCLAVVLLSSMPVVASAWEVLKGTNGVVINRSVDDTMAPALTLYGSYKGGNSWTSSFTAFSASSYTTNTVMSTYMGTNAGSWEIPLPDGYGRCQLIQLSWTEGGSNKYENHAILNEPLNVAVSGAVDVSGTVPVSVVNTDQVRSSVVSVALDASGTMPVSVDSLGSVDSSAIGAGVAVCALSLGVVLYRGVFVNA